MNHETETFDIGAVELTVAVDAGPRILGYARRGGPQLFADLPGEVITSATGDFAFLGGHRLWRAPEIPAITYLAEIDQTLNAAKQQLDPDRSDAAWTRGHQMTSTEALDYAIDTLA